MQEFHTKYIDLINDYKSGNSALQRWKVFEYLVALELNMIVSSDYGPVVEKYSCIPAIAKNDRGTDLVSEDLSRTAQVKSGKQRIGYKDVCTYVANSHCVLDCYHLTLVIEKGVIVNMTSFTYMDEVIEYTFDELMNKVPGTSIGVYIDPFIPPKKLSIEQKVDELYDFINLGGVLKESTMFSNGYNKMRGFVYSCKRSRRFNIPLYDKLFSLDEIKEYYGDIYKCHIDEDVQYSNLFDYHSKHGDEVLQLNIWKECKKHKKLHSSSTLNQLSAIKVFEVDYENYIKENHPVDHLLVRIINGILRLTINYSEDIGSDINSLLDCEQWKYCKENEMTDLWPYSKLSKIKPFSDNI